MMRYLPAIACLLALASGASAHKLGEGYIFLRFHADRIEGRAEMHFNDLNRALPLDGDQDGKISPDELSAGIDKVHAYFREHIRLGRGADAYALTFTDHDVLSIQIGRYALVNFRIDGLAAVPDSIDVHYGCLFDRDPGHRGLVIIEYNERTRTLRHTKVGALVFDPARQDQTLCVPVETPRDQFLALLGRALVRAWAVLDHVLLLVCLCLLVVVRRAGRHWQPVPGFGAACPPALSAFLLLATAHAIGFAGAALNILEPPDRLTGSVAAAATLLIAFSGLVPLPAAASGVLVAVAGGAHGLLSAHALARYGLQPPAPPAPIAGGIVGAAAAQAVTFAVGVPIAYALSRARPYPRVILESASAVIAFLVLVLLVERAFELDSVLRFWS